MGRFLSPKFWLNVRAGSFSAETHLYFVIFLAVFLVATFIFGIVKKQYKKRLYFKVLNMAFSFCLTNLIIGLFLLFFTYENVPILSTRVLFLVWGIGMIVWIVFIARALAKIPRIKQEIDTENEYKKYIP